jgi:hypothetical protein
MKSSRNHWRDSCWITLLLLRSSMVESSLASRQCHNILVLISEYILSIHTVAGSLYVFKTGSRFTVDRQAHVACLAQPMAAESPQRISIIDAGCCSLAGAHGVSSNEEETTIDDITKKKQPLAI